MRANHLFSERINYSVVMILLTFFIVLAVVLMMRTPGLAQDFSCRAPISFYEILPDQRQVIADGEYHLYSYGGFEGRTTYVGKIRYLDPAGEVKRVVRVSREVDSKLTLRKGRLISEITGNNRRVGDHANDTEIKDFIFPVYEKGQVNNSAVFLLNGKTLATGPENIPRILCE